MAKKKTPEKPKPRSFPLPTKAEIDETRKRIRLERKYHRTAGQRKTDILRLHALEPGMAMKELAKEAGVSFVMVRMLMETEDPYYVQQCLEKNEEWKQSGDFGRRRRKAPK